MLGFYLIASASPALFNLTSEDKAMEDETSAQLRLEQARRRLCRNVAAALIGGMAFTDSDICLMAIRMGTAEVGVRRLINRLIDGKSISLDRVSDLFLSMGLELRLELEKTTLGVVLDPSSGAAISKSQIEEEPSGDDTGTAEQAEPA